MTQQLSEAETARRLARMRAWGDGAREGKRMDTERWRGMTPSERVAEGLQLVRIAEKLRSP